MFTCTDPKTMILNMHELRHHNSVHVCSLKHCAILIMYGGLLTDSMLMQSLPPSASEGCHSLGLLGPLSALGAAKGLPGPVFALEPAERLLPFPGFAYLLIAWQLRFSYKHNECR